MVCRAVGWSVLAALTVLGVAGGGVCLGTGGALLVAGTIAGLVALTATWLPSPASTGAPARHPAVLGLAGATIVLAVLGLTFELGAGGWWLTVPTAAAGVLLLRQLVLRQRRHGSTGSRRRAPQRISASDPPPVEPVPAPPLPDPSVLSSLSTAQLCWAWRLSYPRLRRATSPGQLDDPIRRRRGYLDELQRRDPVAFGRWLPTTRAAGDPARVFCRPPPGSATPTTPSHAQNR